LTEGSEFVPIAFVKYVLPAFLAVVCALTACKTTSDRFDLYSPDKPQGPYTAKLMAMNFPTRDVPEVPDTTGTSSQSSSDNTPLPPPPPPPASEEETAPPAGAPEPTPMPQAMPSVPAAPMTPAPAMPGPAAAPMPAATPDTGGASTPTIPGLSQ
jgi:hypothetical protein